MTKMIFAVLDVLLIMGLNIGETDKVFYINHFQWLRRRPADCRPAWRRVD